jgi:macrodomain Ter protein organizer (MatP/YcbG family)
VTFANHHTYLGQLDASLAAGARRAKLLAELAFVSIESAQENNLGLSEEDAYRCPAGEKLKYHYTNEEDGQKLRRYWTNACCDCALKPHCTTGKERRITRWEHEHVLEAVQKRLDQNPLAMRQRRETAEHPFGTLKMRMGATHFLMKRLPKVATEMALHVLAYVHARLSHGSVEVASNGMFHWNTRHSH